VTGYKAKYCGKSKVINKRRKRTVLNWGTTHSADLVPRSICGCKHRVRAAIDGPQYTPLKLFFFLRFEKFVCLQPRQPPSLPQVPQSPSEPRAASSNVLLGAPSLSFTPPFPPPSFQMIPVPSRSHHLPQPPFNIFVPPLPRPHLEDTSPTTAPFPHHLTDARARHDFMTEFVRSSPTHRL